MRKFGSVRDSRIDLEFERKRLFIFDGETTNIKNDVNKTVSDGELNYFVNKIQTDCVKYFF